MRGYELVKEIHDGNIDDCRIKWDNPRGNGVIEVRHRKIIWEEGTFSTLDLTSSFTNFKIIEEQQDIDIQSIEEMNLSSTPTKYEVILHKLVQAVKQLDNKLKEINNK